MSFKLFPLHREAELLSVRSPGVASVSSYFSDTTVLSIQKSSSRQSSSSSYTPSSISHSRSHSLPDEQRKESFRRYTNDQILEEDVIHEASVDVSTSPTVQEVRKSFQKMESAVYEVQRNFEAISLIKELEKSISDNSPNISISGLGNLLADSKVRIAETAERYVGKTRNRHVFLFEEALVTCQIKDNNKTTFCSLYPLTELILNNNLMADRYMKRYNENKQTDNALFLIRHVPANNTEIEPVRYITIYFKHSSQMEKWARQFLQTQQSANYAKSLALQRLQYTKPEPQISDLTMSITDGWYMGVMSGKEAAEKLQNCSDGTFLVRFGTSQMRYAISISFNQKVYHLLIEECPDGSVFLDIMFKFKTVADLINNYRLTSLAECFSHIDVELCLPYNHCKFYRALYDFADTKPGYLGITKGDLIILLDSSTEELGWLRGKRANDSNAKVGFFPKDYVTRVNP